MSPEARIFIAGHRGLAGSALVRRLKAGGYQNLITRPHSELELMDQAAVRNFFQKEKPDVVFLAAARVGGIFANSAYPADFIYENLAVQTNVIHEAFSAGVRHLLFLGSSCIYPRECPQPMREEYVLTGPLEETNRPYAVAKIAGLEMCWAYNRQRGTRYLCAMPTNLYGPGDNYDLRTSHVLAALLRKFHEAKKSASPVVRLWGTGAPRREFLHSDDMADACVYLMELPAERLASLYERPQPPLVNVGCGEDQTIAQLAERVREVVGYAARIEWDPSMPDGTPRKLLDISRLASLGWRPSISLEEGMRRTYAEYARADAEVPAGRAQ